MSVSRQFVSMFAGGCSVKLLLSPGVATQLYSIMRYRSDVKGGFTIAISITLKSSEQSKKLGTFNA